MRFLERFAEPSYALFRAVTGLLFMFHGLQKTVGVLGGFQPPVGSQLWIGGVIELVCGALVAAGLLTRFAAFLSSGTMAVAYVQFHWKLQLGAELLPAVNKGEPALLYAFAFLSIACRGGGRYAVDALLGRSAPGSERASGGPQRLSA